MAVTLQTESHRRAYLGAGADGGGGADGGARRPVDIRRQAVLNQLPSSLYLLNRGTCRNFASPAAYGDNCPTPKLLGHV